MKPSEYFMSAGKGQGREVKTPKAQSKLVYRDLTDPQAIELSKPYRKLIKELEKEYGWPENALLNQIDMESSFRPDAQAKGSSAYGLAQIISKWHPGVDNKNPEESLRYMAKTVSDYTKALSGDWTLGQLAWKTGITHLRKYGLDKILSDPAYKYDKKYYDDLRARQSGYDEPAEPVELAKSVKPSEFFLKDAFESLESQPQEPEIKAEPSPIPVMSADPEAVEAANAIGSPIPWQMKEPEDETKAKPADKVREFYTRSAIGFPLPGVMSPKIAAEMGIKGFGPKPPGGWDELMRPLDENGKPYTFEVEKSPEVEATKSAVFEMAKQAGLQLVATGELAMSLASGMLLYFPSKAYGVMALPFGADVAKIAEEEIASLGYEPYTELGKQALELVGKGFDWFLTPARVSGEAVSKFSPRLGYLTEFGAELMEFAITGATAKGVRSKLKPSTKAKILAKRKTLDEAKLAEKIQAINGIPDEAVRKAQVEILKVEKEQIDLEYKEAMRKVSEDALISEEIGRISEELAKAKAMPVAKTGIKPATKKEIAKFEKEGAEPTKPSETLRSKIKQSETKPTVKLRKKEPVSISEPEPPKKVTEVDLQTGTRTPEALKGENSPFFATAEETAVKTKLFRRVEEQIAEGKKPDIDVYTQKLINDVNRWYHGEDVNISSIRAQLSQMVTHGKELIREFEGDSTALMQWHELVTEAARWAKELERPRGEGGTKLYSGIDPVESIKNFKSWFGKSKIVDSNSKPLKVYHSSPYSFEVFDPNKRYTGIGIHFGTKEQALNRLGERIRSEIDLGESAIKLKPTLLEGYLKIENPLILPRDPGVWDVETFTREAIRSENLEYKLFPKTWDKISKLVDEYELGNISFDESVKKLEKLIQEEGYDGIIYENSVEGKGKSYVVFNSNQFKEVRNKGTWDIKSENIFRSGVDPTEAFKIIKKATKDASRFFVEFDASMKAKEFDPVYAIKQLKSDLGQAFFDIQEPLFKMLRKKYPADYQKLVERQRSAISGKGYGKEVYDQIIRETYQGKSKKVIDLINAISLATRFKAIYSYRAESGYKHPKGYGASEANAVMALGELIKDLNDAQYKLLKKKFPKIDKIFKGATREEIVEAFRANEILNEWHRKMVDDLVEAGRKSPEEGEALKKFDFRKFKSLEVSKLFDLEFKTNLRGETIKVSNSGVQSLGTGKVRMLEPDYRTILAEQTARVYGTIANEKAKAQWKEFAERHPDNGFVSTGTGRPEGWNEIKIKYSEGEAPIYFNKKILKAKEFKNMSGRELYEYAKAHPEDPNFVRGTGRPTPKGWSAMPYFERGIEKKLYFHPDAAKYMVTKSHDVSPRIARLARGITFAPLTRALAVSTSPIWAIFVGLPMDLMHTFFTAKTWEVKEGKGKFKPVYSAFNPLSPLMLGKDLATVLPDIYTKGPFFKSLMKHGLAMPWLTMREGRYMKGTRPPSEWSKAIDILSYVGASLEVAVRAATARRVLMRRAKEKGITFKEALKNEDMMYEAVHAARNRMDYNQGGWFVKAADSCGMIFLNAGVLGARTFWRSALENPIDFIFKNVQLGTLATGITAMGWLLYPDFMKGVRQEGNEKNAVIPLFPETIKVRDRDGNIRQFYLKLRMDPNAAFMYRVFEALTMTYLYDKGLINKEPDYAKLVKHLKELGPVGLNAPPHIQFWIDYVTNYSWWKNRMMYTEAGGRTFDYPKSRVEGMHDPYVSQLAKDVGSITRLSPKRLDDSIGNILPQNNEFVALTGALYEKAFSDVPEEVMRDHWLLTLARMPGFKSVIGITNPGQEIRLAAEDPREEDELEQIVRNGEFNAIATNYYWYGAGSEEDVDRLIDKYEERHIVKALKARRRFIEDAAELPNRREWVDTFHMTPEGKAKTMYNLYGGDLDAIDEMVDLLTPLGWLGDEGKRRFYDKLDELSSK